MWKIVCVQTATRFRIVLRERNAQKHLKKCQKITKEETVYGCKPANKH